MTKKDMEQPGDTIEGYKEYPWRSRGVNEVWRERVNELASMSQGNVIEEWRERGIEAEATRQPIKELPCPKCKGTGWYTAWWNKIDAELTGAVLLEIECDCEEVSDE